MMRKPSQFLLRPILLTVLILTWCNLLDCINTRIVMAEQIASKAVEIMPWKVGQSVEYQIISMENAGGDNRYKFSLVGKEKIDGKIYFWEQIDIYQLNYYLGSREFRKNITLLALVPPLNTEEFTRNPAGYISLGLFPAEAVRLKIQVFDSEFLEVDPESFFSHQDIIERTPYSLTPYAMGKIDFSNMKISDFLEEITVPAGVFECHHIFARTDAFKEYWDEGFDLWRSPKVPILGIVRMEFSKTSYWEKWSYRNESRKIETVRDFFSYLVNKKIFGRRKPDTHIIKLISYSYNQNDEVKE